MNTALTISAVLISIVFFFSPIIILNLIDRDKGNDKENEQ